MRFTPTPLPGLFLVDAEKIVDERGSFARAWCHQEFVERGLATECVQANLSSNVRRGTLRGMHFQLPPYAEDKLVRVLRGAVHDVVLDLRDGSPTYGRWFAVELSGQNGRALFVPQGMAHGYITLTDDCELLYLVSAPYSAAASQGIRWNCDLLRGAWPFSPSILSARDSAWPETVAAIPGQWQAGIEKKAG